MNIHFSQTNSRWDSVLSPIGGNRFELTLQFRIRLVRIEPTTQFYEGDTWASGNGVMHSPYHPFTHKLNTWNDLEWTNYRQEFCRVIEHNWSDKFMLIPNKAWYIPPPAGSDKVSAPVQCSLKIQLVDSASQHPHFTIRCIHPDKGFRSFMSPELRTGIITHDDLKFEWRVLPTKIGKQQHQIEYGQITVLHEFGHVLGFEHVNGSSAERWAYGITLEQRANLMGLGIHFSDKQARPWEATIRRHLIPENKYDRTVKFAGHLSSPQIIAYWDNDFDMKDPPPKAKSTKPAKGASGAHHSSSTIHGPAGVIWEHMANIPPAD
ncbi:zinc metalloprotease [Spirosoma radiotolerans]|uniref:hypothetical protein n=1 Tax=Spirosoma radiotolerans TaxID=1379870 RepID=UPI000695C1A6|nr:hypothetical protein [Spirosoma radiotolerans]